MLRISFRRSTRARILRALFLLLFLLGLIDLISLVFYRHQQFASRPIAPPDVRSQRVFIASIHWNNEQVLRSNWNDAVIYLAKYFGPNTYISIYESGSWDDTKGALRLLEDQLAAHDVPKTIILNETTHADEMREPQATGWIDTPRGKGNTELRRIPYLSRLRNLSLKPLRELAAKGTTFDKVLFLNDVVFSVDDVANLIATRDGDYAAACSMDFKRPPEYYDTFALRDSSGHEAVMSSFPYFRSGASRRAIMRGEPVPVQSCWNGIVVVDAKPFYDSVQLEFRGISDSLAAFHLEGSECCLIHADNPLAKTRGVWLNPNVRVGYSAEAYSEVHQGSIWPSAIVGLVGIWKNRFWRWTTTTYLKSSTVNSRLRQWKAGDAGRSEPGTQCLINEMQVLIENGWAHV